MPLNKIDMNSESFLRLKSDSNPNKSQKSSLMLEIDDSNLENCKQVDTAPITSRLSSSRVKNEAVYINNSSSLNKISNAYQIIKDHELIVGNSINVNITGSSSPGRIKIENLNLQPRPICAWIEHSRVENKQKSSFYIISSFIAYPSLVINCPATLDSMKIQCMGILKIKSIFTRDPEDNSFPNYQDYQGYANMPSITSTQEISLSRPSGDASPIQNIFIKPPWPCKSIEIVIIERFNYFACILNAEGHCDGIRSSSQSTPILKTGHKASELYG